MVYVLTDSVIKISWYGFLLVSRSLIYHCFAELHLLLQCSCIVFFIQIRAKEAQKIEAEMTRTPEDTKRRAMLQRLPELTRIVRTYLLRLKI